MTETMVQAQLSDRRFGAEPVKVRAKVLAERIQALVFRAETNDVVARCGDSNALAERQEGEDERHDDAGHHGADACRPAFANETTHGRASTAAAERDRVEVE